MTNITKHELHNVQIEQRILEVLMTRNEAYDQYSNFISLDLFFAERHKLIYRAIIHLKKADPKQEIDLVLVSDRLQQFGKLSEAGGDSYLSQILDSPHLLISSNISDHVDTLEDLRLRREMSDKLRRVIESLGDREVSALDTLHSCVDNMVNISTGNVQSKTLGIAESMLEFIDEVEYIKEHGVTYMPTGFPELDSVVMADVGNQWVIAGRPSMGKTILAENITRHIAKTSGKVGVIFSLEMRRIDMTRRMVSAESGTLIQDLKVQEMQEDAYHGVYSTSAIMKDTKLFTNDDRSITVSAIKTELARIHRQEGEIGVVMVDYLQIMKEVIEAGSDKHNKIAEVSRSLRAIAQQYNCLMILLSQVNRQCESRPDKRPHMGDLKESSAIEQDADIITMVYRQDKYENDHAKHTNIVEVIVAKNRNGEDKTIRLNFEGGCSRFTNLMPHYQADEIPDYGN
jgi:replicative DNA helicase